VFYFLLVLLILDAFLLMVIVLLQAGKGGGLAAVGGGGSGDTLLCGRQAVTLLTKATWWTGGIFLALCMVLSMMSSPRAADPILRGGAAPGVPGVAEPTQPAGGQLTPGLPTEEAGSPAPAAPPVTEP
jgi:preprotein translocase subunit SecG